MDKNLEKYNKIFMDNFRKKEEELEGLRYRAFPAWDSLGHMQLISELEEAFDISMDTADTLAFTSYVNGKQILEKYGVQMG